MTVELEVQRTIPMEASPAADATFDHTVIGGYLLEERLGVGGYGEVWKAIGPGGLVKAVKILNGRRDGPQAEAELSSLERMRDLRHPFLLNIERIDVCDGRVIVVTELADGSLQQRFVSARQNGAPGIARGELLTYLRDAAEALDFMNSDHGLQHLDVKPENLLFQGSHLKVGDFGLTRDIRNESASLVGGFTPMYSPPELFEGRPSPASDQYSLAIVYQVMLTGVPPFSGRTAAQLTAQHLSSRPDLQQLQPVDRPAVARALSKNPTSRFGSCREFVDELSRRQPNSRAVAHRSRPASALDSESTKTLQLDPPGKTASSTDATCEAQPVAPSTTVTPSPCRPTVYLGLGGMAGQIIASTQQRLCTQFATASAGAFSFLYIDSDAQAIGRTLRTDAGRALQQDSILAVPLKASEEYRNAGHLDWLSRRWLFNIPRSGQVEGMRPLGRLAFVDYQTEIRAQVRRCVNDVLDRETVKAFADSTGLTFETDSLDVVIVASTSGGFGSGSVLDFAYLVRDVVAECGVSNCCISGTLLHSTGRVEQMTTVQEANSACCLRELAHFATAGLSYSGHSSSRQDVCQSAPFDHTYLIHLGDQLTDSGYVEAAEQVGDYLQLLATGPARPVMLNWRLSDRSRAETHADHRLRTFAVRRVDGETQAIAQTLCRATVSRWSESVLNGTARLPTVSDPSDDSLRLLEHLKLSTEALSEVAIEVIKGPLTQAIGSTFREVRNHLPANGNADVGGVVREGIAALDRVVQNPPEKLAGCLQDGRRQIAESTHDVELALRDSFAARLQDDLTATGAVQHLADVSAALEATAATCRQLVNQIERDRRSLSQTASDSRVLESVWQQACLLTVYQVVYRCLVERLRQIRDSTQQLCLGLLRDRSQHLRGLADRFRSGGGSDSATVPDQATRLFEQHLALLAGDDLGKVIDGDAGVFESFMLDSAHGFLLELTASAEGANGGSSPKQFPATAAPLLDQVGGGRHTLALSQGGLAPKWKQRIEAEFGPCLSVAQADGPLTLICEVESIPISAAVAKLTDSNPQLPALVSRVHSRVDIDW